MHGSRERYIRAHNEGTPCLSVAGTTRFLTILPFMIVVSTRISSIAQSVCMYVCMYEALFTHTWKGLLRACVHEWGKVRVAAAYVWPTGRCCCPAHCSAAQHSHGLTWVTCNLRRLASIIVARVRHLKSGALYIVPCLVMGTKGTQTCEPVPCVRYGAVMQFALCSWL